MSRENDFAAFIFAAGEGKRLSPYTIDRPKPMVEIAGSAILEHTLKHLKAAGIYRVALNTCYRAEVIQNFLEHYHDKNITFSVSHEPSLLDTGLGLKKALPLLDIDKEFFAINGDAFWTDGPKGNVFLQMERHWDDKEMDILLLVQPVANMRLTTGIGDYTLSTDHKAARSLDQSGDYMFAGVRICHPRIFEQTPDTPFSFLELMDKAERDGRLYAHVHDGEWHHISTPVDLERVNESFVTPKTRKEQA